MVATTEAVLDEVNARYMTSWRLGGRLSGGYQSGAFLIIDPAGRRAVLKWSSSHEWAPTVVAAAPVVAAARAAGWPTPAWLATGRTGDGYAYQVQDFVEGAGEELVTHAWLDLVLPVLERQAGLGRDGMRNWSDYDHDVVFSTTDGNRAVVADSGPAGAALDETLSRLTRDHREVRLPADDLVHGDFNPGNVLLADGRVAALVDVEAVGRGSRLHDLSTWLLYAWLWGERDVRDRLVGESRRIAGLGWLEVILGAVTVDLLAFGVRNWPPADVATACRAAAELLEQLSPRS